VIVGVVTEIKAQENRVGLVPSGSKQLVDAGHTVLVQRGAGLGSSLLDADYAAAGAQVVDDAAAVWSQAELIVKVKEPVETEYEHFRPGLILYTYLHLAPLPGLTQALVDAEVTGIAYEPAACRSRSVRTFWNEPTAAAECCSGACPASTLPTS